VGKKRFGWATLKRILFLVEGRSEEIFVRRVLDPHLWDFGKCAAVTLITTKRPAGGRRASKGGLVNYDHVKNDLRPLLSDNGACCVTTLFDFYALPANFPGVLSAPAKRGIDNCRARVRHIEDAFAADIGVDKFRAHLALHEHEALLYVDPDLTMENLVTAPSRLRSTLGDALTAAGEPELINESADTAPSRRVLATWSGYDKPTHSAVVAQALGLSRMRSACPHLDAWINDLEAM
jgi:hypothetical protein